MTEAITGLLTGNLITLDAQVPALDGQRVLVLLEPAREAPTSPEIQRQLWQAWIEGGAQGPIDDEPGEADFPG